MPHSQSDWVKNLTKEFIKSVRILMDATPAKWKVFRVIWVPGSPMLWAQTAPTAVPGSILDLAYFSLQMVRN